MTALVVVKAFSLQTFNSSCDCQILKWKSLKGNQRASDSDAKQSSYSDESPGWGEAVSEGTGSITWGEITMQGCGPPTQLLRQSEQKVWQRSWLNTFVSDNRGQKRFPRGPTDKSHHSRSFSCWIGKSSMFSTWHRQMMNKTHTTMGFNIKVSSEVIWLCLTLKR